MGARARPRRCRHRPPCRRPGRNPADAPGARRRGRRARPVRAGRPLVDGVRLVRPLLGWRKAELVALVASAGIKPVDDPSNRDPRHDRVRMREWLKRADWADPERLAASATWLTMPTRRSTGRSRPWPRRASRATARRWSSTRPSLPRELQRRLLLAAFAELGAPRPRGPELARALDTLRKGGNDHPRRPQARGRRRPGGCARAPPRR